MSFNHAFEQHGTWRREQIDLDVNDPAQLAQALEKVAEVNLVNPDEARALGFWNDSEPQDNPPVRPDGLIEVPRWRHALINIAHPLLRQGLVILDTPGLNAVSAEPELIISLIAQAHAVVFILAADTGVTKSDHAISAQKGLVAKVRGDAALLHASQLNVLERALSESVMAQRQSILYAAVAACVSELNNTAARLLQIRYRDLAEQKMELGSLKGKNITSIQQMRLRVEPEEADFFASGARIHAVRSVHQNQLHDVLTLLGVPALMAGIYAMLEPSFRQLNKEFGFSLQLPVLPDITRHLQDLEQIERTHLQYLGLGHVLRLAQAEFSSQLVRALGHRLRQVYALALDEVELWNKSASSQLDAQVRERRQSFARRLQAIERNEQAASGLEERIAELVQQEAGLQKLQSRLSGLTSGLLAVSAMSSMSMPEALLPSMAAVLAKPGVMEAT